MLFVYPAIFHKEDESYWVEFPDLKGCNTYGSIIPEAMEMAQEAFTGFLWESTFPRYCKKHFSPKYRLNTYQMPRSSHGIGVVSFLFQTIRFLG